MHDKTLVAGLLGRRCYTVTEAAGLLGMSRRWVLYQAASGQLPSVRIGSRVLLLREPIDALVPPPSAPAGQANANA